MSRGGLAPDFLTITPTPQQLQQQHAAYPPQHHPQQFNPYGGAGGMDGSGGPLRWGVLNVFLRDAVLVKSYSLLKMDPFVQLQIAGRSARSATATKGDKNPRWNQTVSLTVPNGHSHLVLTIMDEGMTSDKAIAHCTINLEEAFTQRNVPTRPYDLQGKNPSEGSIQLDLTFLPGAILQANPVVYSSGDLFDPADYGSVPTIIMPQQPPPMMYQPQQPMRYNTQPSPQQDDAQRNQQALELRTMFPNLDLEVIRSILDSNNGNADTTLTTLLEMNEAHVDESST
ncbi:hypothetical protein CAOG_05630 [Capsaspora owczarzaki ATCC 30864]|uniref:C2 domain-containing protein n=1 Tax=Capsaspora owczarzaki (strain ATCC 30864) TaxID=595528 RepID=A0A0D2VUU4_CAPO3|nr:hypothetical protein CAOG_05630 [Capsaspora owczarzaki ATCC 30864]KJE95147.1 hypothetical protein CAOG_005630 [Capsaspora owczarzaki ATCC 30864]|eukprot:XP_004346303.1 hypothetical protein CAOG_05630 [Capsaspora owczarzaki ATCC 30864]